MDRAPDLASSFRLDGRVAVVLGGTGVLCSRMADALAAAGARTVVVGRDPERGRPSRSVSADRAATSRSRCVTHPRGELRSLVERVLDRTGGSTSSSTASAPIRRPRFSISTTSSNGSSRSTSSPSFAPARSSAATSSSEPVPTGEGASIVNVGSVSGLTPLSRVFTYSMTKAAVHNLTRNLAREWGHLGIRCNTLVPGFFPAEQNRAVLTPERVAAIIAHTPLGRFGDADELQGATLLLASDAGGSSPAPTRGRRRLRRYGDLSRRDDRFLSDDFLLSTQTASPSLPRRAGGPADRRSAQPPLRLGHRRQSRLRDLTDLWLEDDHYKWRAMRIAGVDERLSPGTPTRGSGSRRGRSRAPADPQSALHLDAPGAAPGLRDRPGARPATAREIWDEANRQLPPCLRGAAVALRRRRCSRRPTTRSTTSPPTAPCATDGRAGVIPTFRPMPPTGCSAIPPLERLGRPARAGVRTAVADLESLAPRARPCHERFAALGAACERPRALPASDAPRRPGGCRCGDPLRTPW